MTASQETNTGDHIANRNGHKRRVLLIASELGKGGAERSISLLSYYLSFHFEVMLCILSGTSRESYYKTCAKVVFIDPPPANTVMDKLSAWRFRARKVKSLKKEFQPDVSISFLEGPDYINILTRRKEKIIISIRGSKQFDKEITGKSGWVRKKILMPFLYKKADVIICVTSALTKEMNRYFGIPYDKMKVIYNFYEEDEIVKKSYEPLSENEQKLFAKDIIIHSGRFHPQKEQDKLITVFNRVKKERDCRLVILGEGKLEEKLHRHASSLGLTICDWNSESFNESDVYFMGFQLNPFKFYKHSKVFALTSSWEGFPNVLMEALICQLPVISTDCPTGPREILGVDGLPETPVKEIYRTSTGSLMPLLSFPSEDILELWQRELLYWLEQPVSDNARFAALTKKFSKEQVLSDWQNLIRN